MKVQSSVSPNQIWVKNIEDNIATIRLRDNITETTNEEGDTIYEYDEVEIEIADRSNLETYINNNFTTIFNDALSKEKSPERLEDLYLSVSDKQISAGDTITVTVRTKPDTIDMDLDILIDGPPADTIVIKDGKGTAEYTMQDTGKYLIEVLYDDIRKHKWVEVS